MDLLSVLHTDTKKNFLAAVSLIPPTLTVFISTLTLDNSYPHHLFLLDFVKSTQTNWVWGRQDKQNMDFWQSQWYQFVITIEQIVWGSKKNMGIWLINDNGETYFIDTWGSCSILGATILWFLWPYFLKPVLPLIVIWLEWDWHYPQLQKWMLISWS